MTTLSTDVSVLVGTLENHVSIAFGRFGAIFRGGLHMYDLRDVAINFAINGAWKMTLALS